MSFLLLLSFMIARVAEGAEGAPPIPGLRAESHRLEFGIRVQILRSASVETHVEFDALGMAEEITAYAFPSHRVLYRERIFPDGRVQEFFGEDGRLSRKVSLTRPGPEAQVYRRESVHFDGAEKIFERAVLAKRVSRDRGLLNACSQALLLSLPLLDEVRQVLNPTSGTGFNLEFSGCTNPSEDTLRPRIEASLRTGLECMLDSARGGSARSERDAQLLYVYLVNRRFSIDCQEVIQDPTDPTVTFAGQGHECPASGSGPGFPGMTLSQSAYRSLGSSTRDLSFSRLVFHEALHSLGHTHGQAPEVTRACERCCFSEGLDSGDRSRACTLCRASDSAGSSDTYLATFIRSQRALGYSDSAQGGVVEAVGTALSMMRPHLGREPYLLENTAIRILLQCGGGSRYSIAGTSPREIDQMIVTCGKTADGPVNLQMAYLLLEIERGRQRTRDSTEFSYADHLRTQLRTAEIDGEPLMDATSQLSLTVSGLYAGGRISGRSETDALTQANRRDLWPAFPADGDDPQMDVVEETVTSRNFLMEVTNGGF